jgi:hypothetical protein
MPVSSNEDVLSILERHNSVKLSKKMPFVPAMSMDPSFQKQSSKKTQNILKVSHDEEDSPLHPRPEPKVAKEKVSMKDYEDLMGKEYKLSVQASKK